MQTFQTHLSLFEITNTGCELLMYNDDLCFSSHIIIPNPINTEVTWFDYSMLHTQKQQFKQIIYFEGTLPIHSILWGRSLPNQWLFTFYFYRVITEYREACAHVCTTSTGLQTGNRNRNTSSAFPLLPRHCFLNYSWKCSSCFQAVQLPSSTGEVKLCWVTSCGTVVTYTFQLDKSKRKQYIILVTCSVWQFW